MPGNRRSSTDIRRTGAGRAAALSAVAIVCLAALHASAWGTPTAGSTGAVITSVSGEGTAGFGGDGGPAAKAQLNGPAGVAVDSAGNVVIADTANHRIRRLDAITGVVTTVAGNGVAGFGGDGGPAAKAQLNGPAGAAVDSADNVVIADTANHRIRRLDAITGVVTTLLGGNELEPTQPAASSPTSEGAVAPADVRPRGPLGVAVDRAGTVFVANSGRNRIDRIDRAEGAVVPAVSPGAAVPAASPGGAVGGVAPGAAPTDNAPTPAAAGGSVCDLVGTPAVAGTVSVNSPVAAPGEDLALQGGGFDAGDQLAVTLCSVPRALGSVIADPAGRYQANVRIPSDVALGSHHLVISDRRGNAAVAPILAQRSGRGDGVTGGDADPNDPGAGLYDDPTDPVDPADAAAAAAEAEADAAADEPAALEDEADAFLESIEDSSGMPTTGSDTELLLKLATLSLASGLVLVSRSRRSTNG